MNNRGLGLICMIGGVAYLIVGIRFLLAGGVEQFGLIDVILSIGWAAGENCGVLGMIAERATGQNKVVLIISYLPIVAFLLVTIGEIESFMTPSTGDGLTIMGLLLLVISMLLVGVFTLFAKTWSSWRKVVPFLPAVMPFLGMFIANLIGIGGGVNQILVALSWILLGYSVLTYAKFNAFQAETA